MANTKHQIIVYLERNKLHLLGNNIQSVIDWEIAPDLIADLEVLKPTELENMIKARLLEQKIEPSPVALILSPDIYFEKDVDPLQPTQTFLDAVPFEHLASATFSFEKKSKLVATNQDLLEVISHAFESAGFQIAAIVPVFLLKQFAVQVDLSAGLTHKNGEAILKNFETLKEYSLFSHHEVFSQTSDTIQQNTSPAKSNRTRVIVMVVIFVTLIGVLIFLVIQNGKTTSSGPQKSISKNTP